MFLSIADPLRRRARLNENPKWTQNAVTVAGGNGRGTGMNQLRNPCGLCVDVDRTLCIVDSNNHRILAWGQNETTGQVVAGGNGAGDRADQLNRPVDVIIDHRTDSLIISDSYNRRVVRWPRLNATNGEIIISNIGCGGIAIDDDGNGYVADYDRHEVRRYRTGEAQGTVVAGGNGPGSHLNQLSQPTYVFVDQDRSVYVSDRQNHRVMKWLKDAKEGILVAGGQGAGNSLAQLSNPHGVVVDEVGSVYVADCSNHRILRWSKNAREGTIVVGGNGKESQVNQLSFPTGLVVDPDGNLYVLDAENSRVQKFDIESEDLC